ncbi:hypothetical protein Tco_1060593 [Tanacetum coccineum]
MDVDGFCKECDKGIKISVTKCMRNTINVVYVHKNVVEGKGAVEEKSVFSYQNKTTIVHEGKHTEQREEAKKHTRLQKELRSKKKKQFLRRFSNIRNDVEKAKVEHRSLLKIISELDGYDNEFCRQEKEQAKYRRRV